ncbi:MAG: LysE family translocator [Pseudomonadota bacterium]
MPSADLLVPFFLAAAAFAFVPGPGMLYAVAQTVAGGRQAGWWSALGLHLAGLGHVAAAAFGVSVLVSVIPALFTVMKLAGAVYLIGMGIAYLTAGPESVGGPAGAPVKAPARRLRDSIIVEALNPKSALFFLLFLPQFADPGASWPIWAQIVVLGLIVNLLFTLLDGLLIEASHGLVRRFGASARMTRLLRRIGGGLLIALGVRLAFARSP